MARPSTASLSVVPVTSLGRQETPSDLTEQQAAIFASVIDSKPADWFGADSVPLVKEYARSVDACDILGRKVDLLLDSDSDGLGEALRDRDRESKRAMSLATKLRLTQQSRYTPQAAATAAKKAGGARPWES